MAEPSRVGWPAWLCRSGLARDASLGMPAPSRAWALPTYAARGLPYVGWAKPTRIWAHVLREILEQRAAHGVVEALYRPVVGMVDAGFQRSARPQCGDHGCGEFEPQEVH